MLLTNPKGNIPDKSVLHQDDVMKKVIHKISPEVIYNVNKELLDSFSDTLVNYSPISINILDYWNKNEINSYIVPTFNDDLDWNAVSKTGKKGKYINPIQGVQDSLAEMFMNNFYLVSSLTKDDHVLRQRLFNLFKTLGIDESQSDDLFRNLNSLFNDERYVTNRDFVTNKGKALGLKYAAKAAWNAEISGPLNRSSFFFEYHSKDKLDVDYPPFRYRVEAGILPAVFDSFVKPLAHPIGFAIDYQKVCIEEFTEKMFTDVVYSADYVSVRCLCNTVYTDSTGEKHGEYDPLIPPPYMDNEENVNCPSLDTPVYVPEKIIGSSNEELHPLWDGIMGDWDTGNILVDIKSGYETKEPYAGQAFTKYIFQNGNYLIEYICESNATSSEEITIEYWRYTWNIKDYYKNIIFSSGNIPVLDRLPTYPITNIINTNTKVPNGPTNIIHFEVPDGQGTHDLEGRWVNKRHCRVHVENLTVRDDITVTEDFSIDCIDYRRNIIHSFIDTNLGQMTTNIVNDGKNTINTYSETDLPEWFNQDFDNDGTLDLYDTDIDGDGVNNSDEQARGTSNFEYNDQTLDTDSDGILDIDESADSIDTITDTDGSGVSDLVEDTPLGFSAEITLHKI